MEPDDRARRRLAEALNDRRLRLRPPLKWGQLAARAQMSVAHLSRIRKNETPLSDLAKASLEEALDWAPGSIDAILASGDPVLAGRDSPDRGTPMPRPSQEAPSRPLATDPGWASALEATQKVLDDILAIRTREVEERIERNAAEWKADRDKLQAEIARLKQEVWSLKEPNGD